MAEKNQIKKDNTLTFLKIPRQWFYDLEAGKWTWEEKDLLEWLWYKADVNNGKVVANWRILADELKDKFEEYKDIPNKINKLMLTLKSQQKLWFPEHKGSIRPVEVELQKYPLMGGGYTDIGYRFQQNSSRTSEELAIIPTELSLPQQNSEPPKNGSNEGENANEDSQPSRTPKTDIHKTNTQTDVWVEKYGTDLLTPLKDYGEEQVSHAIRIMEAEETKGTVIRNPVGMIINLCQRGVKWEDSEEGRAEKHWREAEENNQRFLEEARKVRSPEEQQRCNEALEKMRGELQHKGILRE